MEWVALLKLLIPALTPTFADGLRGFFSRFTNGKGSLPQNIDERIKLMMAENERLKMLAELDRPSGTIAPWVANLRASFRYVCIITIILTTIMAVLAKAPEAIVLVLLDLTGASMAFIIGERMYLAVKK